MPALLLFMGGAASAPGRSTRRATGLDFSACAGAAGFRCAWLRVPVSYAHPDGPTIRLAVAELPATGRRPLGDLVLNPGGPGASGVTFLEQQGRSFPAALRRSFNLVSFDPRGVGQSAPIRCVGAVGIRRLLALNPAPVQRAQVAAVVAATRSFVASCEAHTSRELLANVSTKVTAVDLDRLRAALGQAKLDYLGFSYGTYLGELYAQAFPRHLRAMVLDGVVDPAISTARSDLVQAEGFEKDLDDFFAWCSLDSTCRSELGHSARLAYEALFGRLANGALLTASLKPRYGGVQPVDLGVAEVGLAAALYSEQSWPLLAQALAAGLQGNGSLLAVLAYNYAGLQQDGSYSNIVAANTAISCVDRPSPSSLGAIERLSRALAKEAPDFGASEAWSNLACLYWPVRPQGRVGPIHAPGTPTILVVGSTGDPATPYAWAEAVAHQLDHAVLLTRKGPGHTAYFASACVRRDVDAYLLRLSTPPPGTVCPSN
jgi:pimeloyl-ACP methyl ester carboxylesterase